MTLRDRVVNPRYWAWFDVHRARLWQAIAASLIVAAVFTVAVLSTTR